MACYNYKSWIAEGSPVTLADLEAGVDRDMELRVQGGSNPPELATPVLQPSETGLAGEGPVGQEIVSDLMAPSTHVEVASGSQAEGTLPSGLSTSAVGASNADGSVISQSSASRIEGIVEQVGVNLEYPVDDREPAEDVSQLSSFSKLVDSFKHKFPPQEVEPFDGLTSLERETNVQRVLPVRLCLRDHSKWRFRAVDRLLGLKKNAGILSTLLPLFLKFSTACSYFPGEAPSAGWDNDLLSDLDLVLDSGRRNFLKSAKVSLSLYEIDRFLKSLHRVVEIWSFVDWSVGSIWTNLRKLRPRFPESVLAEVDELLEFLEVSDATLMHGLGDTAYSYINMVLNKRSQILSFCSRDVSQSHKAALLYSSQAQRYSDPRPKFNLLSMK